MSKPVMLERVHLDAVAFASKRPGRYQIMGLQVNADGSTVATNDHMLIRVPASGLDSADFPAVDGAGDKPLPDAGVILPADAVKATLKSLPKMGGRSGVQIPILTAAHCAMNGSDRVKVAVTDLESPNVAAIKPIEGQFPDYKQVTPAVTPESHITIGVDPAYLGAICDFVVRHGGRAPILKIAFNREDGPNLPLVATFEDPECRNITIVLMPKRI